MLSQTASSIFICSGCILRKMIQSKSVLGVILLYCISFAFDSTNSTPNVNRAFGKGTEPWIIEEDTTAPNPMHRDYNQHNDIELHRKNRSEDKRRTKWNYLKNALEIWPYEELCISGAPEECLYTDDQTNKCVITNKDFNVALRILKPIKSMPKNDARKLALICILTDYYRNTLATSTGLINNAHFNEEIGQYIEKSTQANRMRYFGRPVTDTNSLRNTYQNYYFDLFAPKRWRDIGLIGSTDSLYIDSLHEYLKENTPTINNICKWSETIDTLLPDQIANVACTISPGTISTPIRTSFGFFIIKDPQEKIKEEIPFEKAINDLIYLSTRDFYLNTDSVLEEKAYNYYKQHRSEFVTQDTLIIEARLIPVCVNDTSLLKDSSFLYNFKPILIKSISLPDKINAEIKSILHSKVNSDSLITLSSVYGYWVLKILNSKKGGRQLSFRSVRNMLVNKFKDTKDSIEVLDSNTILFRQRNAISALINDYRANEIMAMPEEKALEINSRYSFYSKTIDKRKDEVLRYIKEQYLFKVMNEESELIQRMVEKIKLP